MVSEALHRLPAYQLRDAIRAREISARETVEYYLRRIGEIDARIGAFLSVWHDAALARADEIDRRIAKGDDPGPLAGVPVAMKDNYCTAYGRTTCASRILANFESPYDATVVRKLYDAGAVVLGKLNMDEFAMGSSTENSAVKLTRNPWNLQHVPGGSSGGAAAALVSGMAALTFGSDTGGSIRLPASYCGCLGMKPTYGRVSRYGLVAFASSLDQIGPFALNTRDLAIALETISGRDPMDSTSADLPVPDFSATLDSGIDGLTIGLPKEYFADALGAETRDAIHAAVKVLEDAGATTIEVSLPHTEYAVAVYYLICTAEASANLARFDGVRYGYRHPQAKSVEELYRLSKSHGFGPEVQRRILLGTYALSSGYYDAFYLKAQKVRSLIRRDFTQAFEKCDAIVTPVSPTPAFKIGEKTDDPLEMYLMDIYTTSVNLAGIPGVSVPCGLSASGLPLSFQVLGKPFDEDVLLRVAQAYETHGGVALGEPPIA